MKAIITIETNYSGLKTTYRQIERTVTMIENSFTCKFNGKNIRLEQDEFNGQLVANKFTHYRKVDG